MEWEHLHCCMSIKALVNANVIVGERKKSTTKDLKVQQLDMMSRGQTFFRAGRYRLQYKRALSEGLAQFTGLKIFDIL